MEFAFRAEGEKGMTGPKGMPGSPGRVTETLVSGEMSLVGPPGDRYIFFPNCWSQGARVKSRLRRVKSRCLPQSNCPGRSWHPRMKMILIGPQGNSLQMSSISCIKPHFLLSQGWRGGGDKPISLSTPPWRKFFIRPCPKLTFIQSRTCE